jgi:hypothetical protein
MFTKLIKIILLIILIINMEKCMAEEEVFGRIGKAVLKATVKIETSEGSSGAGFLVSKEDKEGNRALFLVTNKHLIGDYTLTDGNINNYFDFLKIYAYKKEKKEGPVSVIVVKLKNENGELYPERVIVHPSRSVDVALVSVGKEFSERTDVELVHFDISFLSTSEQLKNWNVGIGDQVFTLGYPHNIYAVNNYYPVAKTGTISSMIGEELSLKQLAQNRRGETLWTKIEGKLIIVDGLWVPGNSGGPVIVPFGVRERINPTTQQPESSTPHMQNIVIGIQSSSFGNAGLSIVYSSEYILELLESVK